MKDFKKTYYILISDMSSKLNRNINSSYGVYAGSIYHHWEDAFPRSYLYSYAQHNADKVKLYKTLNNANRGANIILDRTSYVQMVEVFKVTVLNNQIIDKELVNTITIYDRA